MNLKIKFFMANTNLKIKLFMIKMKIKKFFWIIKCLIIPNKYKSDDDFANWLWYRKIDLPFYIQSLRIVKWFQSKKEINTDYDIPF